MADRPWNWKGQRPYMLSMKLGRDKVDGGSAQYIGWAMVNLDGRSHSGELRFDEPLTPERAATEAVLKFREQVIGLPHEKWPTVRLYRYSKKSWPQSIAAAEGDTLEDHIAKLNSVAAALRAEGAKVAFRKV